MSTPGLVRTDLHGHSFFSDGRISPEEYVAVRAKRRFEVIALSDHDTFAGLARAQAAVCALPLEDARPVLVPAMEATSFLHFGTDRAEQVHVLAYFTPSFLDDDPDGSHGTGTRLARTALFARATRVHAAWRAYVLDFVRRQTPEVRAALGEDELVALDRIDGAEAREVSRPRGAGVPPATVHTFPQLQSFILRIAERCPAEFKSFQLDHVHFWDDRALFGWSPEELIDVIRKDGGVDVIAHPVRYRDRERMREVLGYASGIEAYSSRHTLEVASRFRSLAEDLGKHWTASTDDHQHRPYVMPASGTPRHTVDAILRGTTSAARPSGSPSTSSSAS